MKINLKNLFANRKTNTIIGLSVSVVFMVAVSSFVYLVVNNKKSDTVVINNVKDVLKDKSTLNPVEGSDTNIIAMVLVLTKSEANGVKVEILNSSNPQISKTGVITYGSSKANVSIEVKITKNDKSVTYTFDVIIPAKSANPVKPQTATKQSTAQSKTSTPGSVTNISTQNSSNQTQSSSGPTIPDVSNSISVKDYGAKGDESVDDTAAIQKAIDYASSANKAVVIIPTGTYLINPDISINMKSNITLSLASGAILKATASGNTNYEMIELDNVKNSSITGGKIIGDRNIHTGTSGEWGMGIDIINGSNNIHISNISIVNCWGDGVYIGGTTPSNITIDNITSDNNRRQGMSITNASNVGISNSAFTNTNGTLPESGIDIEPNAGEIVDGIKITNVNASNNNGDGIELMGPLGIIRNIEISNSNIQNNLSIGLYLDNASDITVSGDTISGNYYGVEIPRDVVNASFKNVDVSNNKTRGVSIVTQGQNTGTDNITFLDSVISNNSKDTPGVHDGIRVDSMDDSSYMKNIKFMNTKFIDNQSAHTQRFGLTVGPSSVISNVLLYIDCTFSGNISGSSVLASSVTQNVPR